VQPASPARLTVLSGPSGVGKGTVVAEVRRRHPDVWVSVSVTTRRPRDGEVDGVHYHFVDDAEFDRLIAEDGLLEWAEYAGNRYGTPVRPVQGRLDSGAPALLEIELQGARQVRARAPEAQLVFLAPPSWKKLVSRLASMTSPSSRSFPVMKRVGPEARLAASLRKSTGPILIVTCGSCAIRSEAVHLPSSNTTS